MIQAGVSSQCHAAELSALPATGAQRAEGDDGFDWVRVVMTDDGTDSRRPLGNSPPKDDSWVSLWHGTLSLDTLTGCARPCKAAKSAEGSGRGVVFM